MGCLSPTVRARKLAQIEKLEAQLAALEDAYTATLTAGGTGLESYRFDSAEGSQQAKLLDVSKLQEQITFIESRINRLRSEVEGTAVVSIDLRRR